MPTPKCDAIGCTKLAAHVRVAFTALNMRSHRLGALAELHVCEDHDVLLAKGAVPEIVSVH
jgi:hypothetical protein